MNNILNRSPFFFFFFFWTVTLIHQGALVQAIIYLIPLHIWLILLLASYARVVIKEPGTPKKVNILFFFNTVLPYLSVFPFVSYVFLFYVSIINVLYVCMCFGKKKLMCFLLL